MSRDWGRTFRGWAGGPGSTEERHCENALKAVRDAIANSANLRIRDTEVLLQGSYRNRVNIGKTVMWTLEFYAARFQLTLDHGQRVILEPRSYFLVSASRHIRRAFNFHSFEFPPRITRLLSNSLSPDWVFLIRFTCHVWKKN